MAAETRTDFQNSQMPNELNALQRRAIASAEHEIAMILEGLEDEGLLSVRGIEVVVEGEPAVGMQRVPRIHTSGVGKGKWPWRK